MFEGLVSFFKKKDLKSIRFTNEDDEPVFVEGEDWDKFNRRKIDWLLMRVEARKQKRKTRNKLFNHYVIVRFSNNTYGVRSGWIFYSFVSFGLNRIRWSYQDEIKMYCQTESLTRAEELLNLLITGDNSYDILG